MPSQKSIPISELITTANSELLRLDFKRSALQIYCAEFRKFSDYYSNEKIQDYTATTGREYFQSIYGVNIASPRLQLTKSQSATRRAIRLLDDIFQFGYALRYCHRSYTVNPEYNILKMAPAIMLLRIVIRINIVRCISVNKIEITVLSARVLDALSGRGLKAKTVHEFERYGTRRIVKHCLGKGQILYSKETVQNFVWQERAKQESGTLPHYQWGITRRAAVYLDQMAEYGKIQDEPIRPWEAEHNPLFQAISCNPSNSMKVIDIICRTRDAVMQLELSDKTKTNYIYCGFGAILNFFISRGEESYSPETLALFVKTVQENFVNGAIQKASFQTMRKAAHWIEEYLSTGQVSQQKLRKYNFACAPPEFENLLSQYQLYMDNENYLKEGSRQFYLSSVRTFFRTIATLGIYRYAEITLPDVTRCLAKISETFPLGIFNLTGSMRSFARFMAEKHPELPDISPALVFSAAKRRRVYVGYTHEDAQKIFSAINRSSTMGMRDYAMIMLAYTTGLRGCDIVNLKFDSIDWDACELRLVQEKTNIPVSLPLDTKTGNAIADYILHARPKCKSEYIFLRVLRPYTKIGSMWTVIAKYAHIALGKDRKMNGPHAFRRGMGRQLLEANIPAPLICDILGHSSSVSLRQYTASSLEKLKVCAGTISAIPIAQEALL